MRIRNTTKVLAQRMLPYYRIFWYAGNGPGHEGGAPYSKQCQRVKRIFGEGGGEPFHQGVLCHETLLYFAGPSTVPPKLIGLWHLSVAIFVLQMIAEKAK